MLVKRAVQIVGGAADGFAFILETRYAVGGDAVDRHAARDELAVPHGIVAHFAVVYACGLFQHVLQRIQVLVFNLLFRHHRERLRGFALCERQTGSGGRIWHGVVDARLFGHSANMDVFQCLFV